MKQLSQRTVFAVLIGALLFFLVIMVIELDFKLGWMLAGFGVVAVAGFVFLYMRFAPLVIAGTLGLLVGGYLLYKFGDKGIGMSAGVGAIAAIILLLLFQVGWVGKTGYSDYVKDQKAIFEKEQGGGLSYAQQQQALYDQQKAREGQGGPQGPGPG